MDSTSLLKGGEPDNIQGGELQHLSADMPTVTRTDFPADRGKLKRQADLKDDVWALAKKLRQLLDVNGDGSVSTFELERGLSLCCTVLRTEQLNSREHGADADLDWWKDFTQDSQVLPTLRLSLGSLLTPAPTDEFGGADAAAFTEDAPETQDAAVLGGRTNLPQEAMRVSNLKSGKADMIPDKIAAFCDGHVDKCEALHNELRILLDVLEMAEPKPIARLRVLVIPLLWFVMSYCLLSNTRLSYPYQRGIRCTIDNHALGDQMEGVYNATVGIHDFIVVHGSHPFGFKFDSDAALADWIQQHCEWLVRRVGPDTFKLRQTETSETRCLFGVSVFCMTWWQPTPYDNEHSVRDNSDYVWRAPSNRAALWWSLAYSVVLGSILLLYTIDHVCKKRDEKDSSLYTKTTQRDTSLGGTCLDKHLKTLVLLSYVSNVLMLVPWSIYLLIPDNCTVFILVCHRDKRTQGLVCILPKTSIL